MPYGPPQFKRLDEVEHIDLTRVCNYDRTIEVENMGLRIIYSISVFAADPATTRWVPLTILLSNTYATA
jgi:hypothetical protein